MLDKDYRVVITKRNNKTLLYLLNNLKPELFYKFNNNIYSINNIYVGRVQKVKNDLNAAFVEISNDVVGFLPFDQINPVFVLSRKSAGEIHENDRVLVMITKEQVKTKPVELTMNISLQGKYSVLHTDKCDLNASAKLDKETKKFLVNEVKSNISESHFGITIRTNAKNISPNALINEIKQLSLILTEIINTSKSRVIYSQVYKAKPAYVERIHSLSENIGLIITDNKDIYDVLTTYENEINCELYNDEKISLSALYSLEKIYKDITEKTVLLKSGGSIVIEPTEALTVIDVNSGKISKKNKEEAIRIVNREAAIEIFNQLKLRNISGIIIIDFINYSSDEDRQELISIIKEEAKKDSIRTNFIDITELGLIELTRQKKYSSIYDE